MPTSAQARLSCIQALFLALSAASALWVADAASMAAKEQIRMNRDIAISDLSGISGSVVVGSPDGARRLKTSGIHWDCSVFTVQTAKAGEPG
jgi:hypothetical protein